MTVLGKGRSVVGGSIKYDLPRADVEKVLLDGFFPECRGTPSRPGRGRRACRNSGCRTSPTRR